MSIPKTAKGLSNRITKIRSQLSAFKREYGFIDDGAGARYYLFYLYFLLADNRRSSEFLRCFEKEFPDDSGEPFQLLCWALILNRMGKNGEYQLARTMLSNIYLIPSLLGFGVEREVMSHLSNWAEPDFIEYFPERVQENITEEDLSWIHERYHSDSFQKILNRHIEINHELESTPRGEKRSALVKELSNLVDTIG
ncbi:hypothetical protein [Oceanispirochaeta sp.]|jgi:hypothetical protein|uniref:hypothetical protein n=1 Tax=Oceanispirochaeta sp. TaxID=2035350 RepID=UPI002605E97F|nr:hypothetical protein [Oceanispirochaeta sp.]MDA3955615.1 hypothetical protein [Oceanispirochaeta sp.]